MISYCCLVFRPVYFRLMLEDVLRKTRVTFEVLLWLNVDDAELEEFIQTKINSGFPIRIVGKTPENIGARALPALFNAAKYDIIAFIEDDVIAISPHIAERADEIFKALPEVKMLVADTVQDRFTRGSRPPMEEFQLYNESYGLYFGPIDGWLAVFHRSGLNWPCDLPDQFHYGIFGIIYPKLDANGFIGLLCTKLKVFHITSPQYAYYFGRLNEEIEKYHNVGFDKVAEWYEAVRDNPTPIDEIATELNAGIASLCVAP